MARVLMALRGVNDAHPLGEMLLRQAARIAINRTVAGVHYPMDSRAGQVLGTSLAEYVVARCGDPALTARGYPVPFVDCLAREFDAEAYLPNDFQPPQRDRVDEDGRGLTCRGHQYVPPSHLLGWLWAQAAAEWR